MSTKRDRQKKLFIKYFQEIPIIVFVCKKVGISRSTFYRWCREDKEFYRRTQAALIQGMASVNDLAESTLITLIKKGNITAIIYWLKHNHPRFGEEKNITVTQTQMSEVESAMIQASWFEDDENEKK